MASRDEGISVSCTGGITLFETESSSDNEEPPSTQQSTNTLHTRQSKPNKEEGNDEDIELDQTPVDPSKAYAIFMQDKYRVSSKDSTKARHSHIKETPFERLQRLQREMQELSQDVETIKSNGGDVELAKDANTGHSMWSQLDEQIETLRKQLETNQLALDHTYVKQKGDEDSKHVTETLKEIHNKAKATYDVTGDSSTMGGVTPVQVDTTFVNNLKSLGQRLDKIESTAGTHPSTFSDTKNVADGDNLSEQVKQLEKQISLLDPAKMQQCADKARELSAQLQEIRKSTSSQPSKAHVDRIQNICGKVEKWDYMAESLPSIADRLSTLRLLHSEASLFSQRLSHLEQTRNGVENQLKEDAELLKELKTQLGENMSHILDHVQKIDQRIDGLSTS